MSIQPLSGICRMTTLEYNYAKYRWIKIHLRDFLFKINKFKHFNKSLKLSTVGSFAFIRGGEKIKKIA